MVEKSLENYIALYTLSALYTLFTHSPLPPLTPSHPAPLRRSPPHPSSFPLNRGPINRMSALRIPFRPLKTHYFNNFGSPVSVPRPQKHA